MNLGQHSSGKLQSIRFVFQAEAFDLSGTQKTNARCLTNYSPGREHALNRDNDKSLMMKHYRKDQVLPILPSC